jgi:catechol 2,3-dioxygenase-like lactoylglutathione lyase family enzyme
MADEGAAHVILKTLDMAETIRWYTAVGFELRDRFPETDPTWCEVARDDLVVQFLGGDTPWPGVPVMTGCLYIHPLSVTAVHDELRGVIDLGWGVEDRDWGRRELVVRDPNGYYLTFAEDT